jgi:hypothetical protein
VHWPVPCLGLHSLFGLVCHLIGRFLTARIGAVFDDDMRLFHSLPNKRVSLINESTAWAFFASTGVQLNAFPVIN